LFYAEERKQGIHNASTVVRMIVVLFTGVDMGEGPTLPRGGARRAEGFW